MTDWLRTQRPGWRVSHVNELSFQGKPDEFLYLWAQEHGAIVVTFDEHFADARTYPLGKHHGVVRLRVWPTTIEETQGALARLMGELPAPEWSGKLIIIDNEKIRMRKA